MSSSLMVTGRPFVIERTMEVAPPRANGRVVMTNFDHTIDREVEERARASGETVGYPAENFYGHVWFADGKWHCMVMQYHQHIETLVAASLEEIMDEASHRYGAE